MQSRADAHQAQWGYTILELLVVLAALGLLLSIAAPKYSEHVDRAREVALKQSLSGIRDAIDKFYADRARYPKDMQELVTERYLRQMPVDPLTDRSDSWVVVAPEQKSDVLRDVHSGAPGKARDGTAYAAW